MSLVTHLVRLQTINGLYSTDVALYVATCTDKASPMHQCAAFRRVCERELERLHRVCGTMVRDDAATTMARPNLTEASKGP